MVVASADAVGAGVEVAAVLISVAIEMISFANSSGREEEEEGRLGAVGFAGRVWAFGGAEMLAAGLADSNDNGLAVISVGVIVAWVGVGVGVVVGILLLLLMLLVLYESRLSLADSGAAGASLAIAKTTIPQKPLIVNLSLVSLLSSLRYMRISGVVRI